MIHPLTHYVVLLDSGTLLESLRVPVLVWRAPPEGGNEGTKESTRFDNSEASAPILPTNGLAFELVTPAPSGSVILGRSSDCHVQLLHDGISRQHLEFSRSKDGWSMRDLRSKNGTWLAGSRVPALTMMPLNDGDQLRVGHVELLFMSPSSFRTYLKRITSHEPPTQPGEP